MITITTHLQIRRTHRGRKRLTETERRAKAAPGPTIPRVARLMALAIKFRRMLDEGVVRDQSELARLARVTQPRITQILNLSYLAPQIQEELLFLTQEEAKRRGISEKTLKAHRGSDHVGGAAGDAWPMPARPMKNRSRRDVGPRPGLRLEIKGCSLVRTKASESRSMRIGVRPLKR